MTHEERNPTLSHAAANDNRFAAGVVVTVLWLVVVAALVWWKRDKVNAMELNAIGDFMAGAFAPLAFFWLVLGYLQQGDELRNSQKALLLQADELRASVEQQRELVEVSRQQVESEREALEYERAMRDVAAKPRFELKWAGASRGVTHTHSLQITNGGGDVTSLLIYLDGDERVIQLFSAPMFQRGASQVVGIPVDDSFNDLVRRLHITYVDGIQRQGLKSYQLVMVNNRLQATELTLPRSQA